MATLTKRDYSIDTLRGLACILLVEFHVVGPLGLGLNVEEGFWRHGNDLLTYLRMPLFTFLSGLIYARRPFVSGVWPFFKGKMRRLLLPMLFVGTTFALLGELFAGESYEWQVLHIKPVAYMWYLEALFLIFVVVAALEKGKALSAKLPFVITLSAAVGLYLGLDRFVIEWFGISGSLFLLPFFLLGLGYTRFQGTWTIKNWIVRGRAISSWVEKFGDFRWAAWLALVVSLGTFGAFTWAGPFERGLIGVAFSCLLCLLLVAARLEVGVLARLGVYSYSVYLFHTFFISFAKQGLFFLGVKNVLVHVLVGTPMGLFGPLAIHEILRRNRFTATCFLGMTFRAPSKSGQQQDRKEIDIRGAPIGAPTKE